VEVADITTDTNNLSLEADGGQYEVVTRLKEQTQTVDPGVVFNGQELRHSGTLADGETVSLTGNKSWLVEGENNVQVVVDDPGSGAPAPQVNVTVEHDSQDTQTYDSTSGKWEQQATVTKSFPSDRTDATVEIALDDSVVNVTSLQECRNGSCTDLSSSDYTHDTDDDVLTVDLGAVDAGENISVEFVARKVSVRNGEIDVLDLTPPGSDLATEFEVVEHSEGFNVDVSNTGDADRIHYVDQPSWTGSPFARIGTDGSQAVHLPDAGVGSTGTMRTLPVSGSVDGGHTDVRVLDAGALKFRVANGTADTVSFTYLAANPNEPYRLWSVDSNSEEAAADGPNALFTVSGQPETYLIEEKPRQGGAEAPVGPVTASEGGPSVFALLALFGGMAGALLAAVFVGRRLGFDTGRSNALLAAVGVTVGVVGVELATADSVVGTVVEAVLSGTLGGGAGAVVVGVLLLTGLFVVDARFLGLPNTVLFLIGGLVVLYTVNGVTDGALADGLRETGALIWLLLVGGAVAVLYRMVKGPTINIGGK